jgi:hypothetical protein
MEKVKLDDIKWARWSGADESRPAVMRDGIPCQLSRDELELALVGALEERQALMNSVKISVKTLMRGKT